MPTPTSQGQMNPSAFHSFLLRLTAVFLAVLMALPAPSLVGFALVFLPANRAAADLDGSVRMNGPASHDPKAILGQLPTEPIVFEASPPRRSPPASANRQGVYKPPQSSSRKDIFQSRLFAEALTAGGPESWRDRQRVAEFVRRQHADQAAIRSTEDLTARLKSFLADHAESPYSGSLLVNLAENYYQSGYFSKALDAWRSAWENLRQAEAGPAKALADQVFGQYLLMLARIGRLEEMESLLSEQRHRRWSGPVAELIAGAKESIWNMKNRPGLSFRCGPFALANCYLELGYATEDGSPLDIIREARSTYRGVSLLELEDLARAAGMNYVAVKKAPDTPFDDSLLPLVAHWKLDHYGAVLGRVDTRYEIKDPTFIDRFEVTAAALNDQSSGYFLVANRPLPPGWQRISKEEAAGVWGRGAPPQKDSDDNSVRMGGNGCRRNKGMPRHSFSPVLVGLSLTDTPLRYHTPYGPAMRITLQYSQRDSHQPANFTYANLGHRWNLNWIGYIKDDSLNASADVEFYLDGVNQTFTDYDADTSSYGRHRRTQAKLVRISSDPIEYELRLPSGSKLLFSESDGVIGTGRKVFLTRKSDPQGNEALLSYDARMRLTAVTDVLGQVSTFSYGLYGDDFKITGMTDPFGRTATLGYDEAGRLVGITDQGGLTSSFDYDSGYFIQALITPYGTTTFVYGENGAERWIEATDPYGDRERLEFRHHDVVNDDRNFPIPDSESTAPSNFSAPNIRNSFLSERNTFYWDKEAMHAVEAKGYTRADKAFYALADITHWLFKDVLHGVITTIPESVKKPLENRVWFTYPGQTHASVAASEMMAQPKQIGRVLDDGSNRTFRYTYNDLGQVTNSIDPKSRNFTNVYATNGIDLLETRQTYGSNDELMASYTYNSQHLPLTLTDAAGETSTFTYNSRGQPTLITDPLGEQTRYTYDRDLNGTDDAEGYLSRVERTSPRNATNFVTLQKHTYHPTGKPATSTDSDGYTLSYTYDSFDRLTSVIYPDGTKQDLIYDRLHLAAQKDRENRWTRNLHDALGRRTATIDPMGRLTQMEWCHCGDLNKLIDANGNSTRWVRDLQGRVIKKIYADGSSYHFSYYDSISWLKTRTDALDQVTAYTYEKDGNLSAVSYTDTVNPTAGVTFKYAQTYDRITEMRDGIGATKYYYHPVDGTTLGAGQLREVNGAFRADLIKFDYDKLGRVKTRKVNNVETDYRFDSLGRLTGTTNPLGEFSLTYYGPTARVRKVQYPNGQQVEYKYYGTLGDFRLRSLYNADASGANLSRFDYKYSPQGNITGWLKRLGKFRDRLVELSYDRADRLIGARHIVPFTTRVIREYGYVYDGVGNRVAERVDEVVTGATYNKLNQLIATGGGGPVRFSGTTDEPAQVTVDGEAAIPSDGGRAFERNLDFTAGSHNVEITATDASGNTSSRTTFCRPRKGIPRPFPTTPMETSRRMESVPFYGMQKIG